MLKSILQLLPFPLLMLLVSCSDSPTSPIITPDPNEPVDYCKHIQPIFNASCGGSGCHLNGGRNKLAGPMTGNGLSAATTDLALDTWQDVMNGGAFGVVVVPYEPTMSDLLRHINLDESIAPVAVPHMPTADRTLPLEQILTIKRWIVEGAKNCDGAIALSDPNRPRVFVTAQAQDGVSVIDVQTQRMVRLIHVGTIPDGQPESPHNIVFSPDQNYFYLNLINTGIVEKRDARTFEKVGEVQVGLSPAQIAVTTDGSTLYVSNYDLSFSQKFVNRVDAATLTVTGTIDEVGLAPHGVTLSRDERYLYTINSQSDDVAEVDLQSPDFEITRRFSMKPNDPLPPGQDAEYQPYQSVLSPDGTLMFVTCRLARQVRVIDLVAGRVIDSIPVGLGPLILEITPNGREIWVPNHGDDNISIINVATRSVVATVPGIEKQPHAIAFSADGTTAFVSCENQNGTAHHAIAGSPIPGKVYVVNVSTRTVKRSIEVGAFAAGIIVGK